MKHIRLIGLVGLIGFSLVSCNPKKADVETAAEPQVVETTVEEQPSKADDELRLMKRGHAIADLISAHQRIYRDEVDVQLFKGFIRAETSPGEIAVLQNDLSEIQAEMRETKAKLPDLEAAVEALSETGDPRYQLALATYNADLAEAMNVVARARREGAANAGELKDKFDAMIRVSAEDVLAGKYEKP
jgi:hypothetical protein